MSSESQIEWTDATWNPVVGCTHVSDGCGTFADGVLTAGGCYAARDASGRLSKNPTYVGLATEGRFTGEVRLLSERLDKPLKWRSPRLIFVNSMSDLFHDGVPDDYIADVFAVMVRASQHTFQVLTKRHARMRSLLNSDAFWNAVNAKVMAAGGNLAAWCAGVPPENIWIGVSVEDQHWFDIRVPALRDTPATVRFLSCEPLLGPITGRWRPWVKEYRSHEVMRDRVVLGHLDSLRGIGWVIAGGESGPKARPMHPAWVREIRDACDATGVAFHFKQWGEWSVVDNSADRRDTDVLLWPDGGTMYVGDCARPDGLVAVRRVGKRSAGRELDGRTHDDMPARAELVS